MVVPFEQSRTLVEKDIVLAVRNASMQIIAQYNQNELIEEVMKHYISRSDMVLSILFVNKKQFCSDFFKKQMGDAANTYCSSEHDKLLDNEIAKQQADAITFLNENQTKMKYDV